MDREEEPSESICFCCRSRSACSLSRSFACRDSSVEKTAEFARAGEHAHKCVWVWVAAHMKVRHFAGCQLDGFR